MASPGRRVRLRDTWHPVYDYGCGWQDCPECAAGVALEIQRAHEKMRDSTLLCMQLDTPEEAAQRRDRRGGGVRESRLTARAKLRVKRVLTPTQREQAIFMLANRPVARSYLRADGGKTAWLAEVWLELENPTISVASREATRGRIDLERRVSKAVKRAENRMLEQSKETNSFLSVEDFSQ